MATSRGLAGKIAHRLAKVFGGRIKFFLVPFAACAVFGLFTATEWRDAVTRNGLLWVWLGFLGDWMAEWGVREGRRRGFKSGYAAGHRDAVSFPATRSRVSQAQD